MKISNREKREWSLLIFIVPIGICLMMIAGQIAVRIVPNWTVDAGMQSSLNLGAASKKQGVLIQPLLPEILTPIGWFDTFLTPNSDSGDNVAYPPFIVFEPTVTPPPPSSTPSTTTETAIPTLTATSSPPVVTNTPSGTPTKPPKEDGTATVTITATVTTTATPTATATATATTTATPTATATANPTTTPATIDPALTINTAIVATGTPDGNILDIPSGTYVVVDITGNPVIVENTPDGNYDLTVYEYNNAGSVLMDHVSIGISHLPDGSSYWQVFNWGDGIPDTNSNVGSIAGTEADNQVIALNDLYPPGGTGTGVLIDVDNATSSPPPGSYDYIVIISPVNGGDAAQVDSIDITEVPLPAPTP